MTSIRSDYSENFEEMGGYFGLELPDHGDAFPDAIKFQSGRAALRAVIECAGIKKVIIPAYTCDSVIHAVVDSGGKVDTYFLDDSMYPQNIPSKLPPNHAFLYVNYFGLCQRNVDRLLKKIPSQQLIIDNCQALFALSQNALATIYSPRKYLGVPDGGFLVTSSLDINDNISEDTGSIERMRHLLLRMAYKADSGYVHYQKSENSFVNTAPLRMSRLAKRILNSIDMMAVKQKRRENFLILATRLDKFNQYSWELNDIAVPLCYPLIIGRNVEELKRILAKKRIYIPTYWPDAQTRILPDGIEYRLINRCLAVPCDQRYSPSQMLSLADQIIALINK